MTHQRIGVYSDLYLYNFNSLCVDVLGSGSEFNFFQNNGYLFCPVKFFRTVIVYKI